MEATLIRVIKNRQQIINDFKEGKDKIKEHSFLEAGFKFGDVLKSVVEDPETEKETPVVRPTPSQIVELFRDF